MKLTSKLALKVAAKELAKKIVFPLFAFPIVAFTFALNAQAAVTLITPEEIPVLALDQQEVTGGFFRSAKTTYKLDAGAHDIAVRYEQLFNLNNGEHDILKSALLSVHADLEDNKTYRLSLINPPKNYDVAKDYVKQPIVAIIDEQGRIIAQQQGLDNVSKSALGSTFLNRVLDFRNKSDDVKQLYANKDISNNQPRSNKSTSDSMANSESSSALSTQGTARVEQLKQLWQQTTEQERQQFMQFIIR